MKFLSAALVLPALAGMAAARLTLEGCISATISIGDEDSLVWFVPETGELCELLDCGGGRAPPRHDVPGCPQYTGTATHTPTYIPTSYITATTTEPTATQHTSTQPTVTTPTATETTETLTSPSPTASGTTSVTSNSAAITPPSSRKTTCKTLTTTEYVTKTKCSLSKTATSSRPLITHGPTAAPSANFSAPSAPSSTSIIPIGVNGAAVPGYSAAGAIVVVAAVMGVAL